jgi:hypothetical protein
MGSETGVPSLFYMQRMMIVLDDLAHSPSVELLRVRATSLDSSP